MLRSINGLQSVLVESLCTAVINDEIFSTSC